MTDLRDTNIVIARLRDKPACVRERLRPAVTDECVYQQYHRSFCSSTGTTPRGSSSDPRRTPIRRRPASRGLESCYFDFIDASIAEAICWPARRPSGTVIGQYNSAIAAQGEARGTTPRPTAYHPGDLSMPSCECPRTGVDGEPRQGRKRPRSRKRRRGPGRMGAPPDEPPFDRRDSPAQPKRPATPSGFEAPSGPQPWPMAACGFRATLRESLSIEPSAGPPIEPNPPALVRKTALRRSHRRTSRASSPASAVHSPHPGRARRSPGGAAGAPASRSWIA